MPKALGLMNPDNASKGGGAFREGIVRIDSNCYMAVHQGKAGEAVDSPIPATKWMLRCTRLQENGEDVMVDEHDSPVTEELVFSFGGKCLPFIHPGKADSVDDEEVEDLGTHLGVEGNTVFLVAQDWKPNEKSGLMVFTRSLQALAVKNEFLNRCWCPDWNGCVLELKSQPSQGADGKTFNYKVASRVLVAPGGTAKKAGKSASNGKSSDVETILAPILHAMSQELDGTAITRKAFLNRVRGALDQGHVDSKLLVPVLSLCKDDKWLSEHGTTFDFALDAANNTITFGVPGGL